MSTKDTVIDWIQVVLFGRGEGLVPQQANYILRTNPKNVGRVGLYVWLTPFGLRHSRVSGLRPSGTGFSELTFAPVALKKPPSISLGGDCARGFPSRCMCSK